MINFKCKFCRRPIAVPDAHAGQRAVCPYCQANLDVPGARVVFEEDTTGTDYREYRAVLCPRCGETIQPTASFCTKCGFQTRKQSVRKRTAGSRRVKLPPHLRKKKNEGK